MGKPTPPAPPDPVKTSQAQTASNVDTALATTHLNAINQNTPWGSVRNNIYSEKNIGGRLIPQYTQEVSLSPEQQALYDRSVGIQRQALDTGTQAVQNVQGTIGSPFSLQNLPTLQTGVNGGEIQRSVQTTGQRQSLDRSNLPKLPGIDDFGAERQRVEDAYLGRFNTDIARNRADTASRMNAMGLQQGSEAWNREMERLDRQAVDARNAAIMAGGAEQSRLFNMASGARGQLFGEEATSGAFENDARNNIFNQYVNAGNFANASQGQQFGQLMQNVSMQNQARQQAINEQQLARNQSINELSALLGMGQIQTPSGAPSFGANVAPTDVLGAYAMHQQGLQNNYNQQMQQASSFWNALGGLGGRLGSAAIGRWR